MKARDVLKVIGVTALALTVPLTGCTSRGSSYGSQRISTTDIHDLGELSCEDHGGVWIDNVSGCLTPTEIRTWQGSVCGCEDYYTCKSMGFPKYSPDRPYCGLDGWVVPDQLPTGAISWEDAWSHVGSAATVCGDVVGGMTAYDSNGQPTFLDIGRAYPDPAGVTIVIWGEDAFYNFGFDPVPAYSGESVCVSGELYSYDGRTQVQAWSPSQIQVKT